MYLGFFVVGRKNTTSFAASSTNYQAVGQGIQSGSTTESNSQVPFRTACTLSNLYVRVVTNDRGSSTFTLRKGAADLNNTVTVGASATGEFQDTTHTDVIAAGDLIDLKSVIGSGGTTFNHQLAGIQISGTAMVKAASSQSTGNAGTNGFIHGFCQGRPTFSAAEAVSQSVAKATGVFRYISMNVSANTRTDTTTIRSRVNGANGGSSFTVATTATGIFEDTSGTDTLAIGDLVNLSITMGAGSGTITTIGFSTEWLPNAFTAHFQSADTLTTIAPSTSNTYGFGCTTGGAAVASESAMQALRLMTCRVTNLRFYTAANSLSDTATVRSRIDGANGNLSLTVGAAATGAFTDDAHIDFVVPASEFNWEVVTIAGGTTLELDQMSALFTVPNELAMVGAG